jgi:hypothetical protein
MADYERAHKQTSGERKWWLVVEASLLSSSTNKRGSIINAHLLQIRYSPPSAQILKKRRPYDEFRIYDRKLLDNACHLARPKARKIRTVLF